MLRPLAYVVLLAACIGSCATSPRSTPTWLCGSYESPPRSRDFVRQDGQRDTWKETEYLDLKHDGTCCLHFENGRYPSGRWVLETPTDGSMRVLVWPVGPHSFVPPTPEDEFLLFAVAQHGDRVDLVRNGETWTSAGNESAATGRIDESVPFMEHPSNKDETAVDAMADAVTRLRQLETWDRWITFSAQGQGGRVDSYHCAELKLLHNRIDPGKAVVDAEKALRAARLDKSGVRVSRSPEGYLVLHRFSPWEVASFMDALFREQMGIRPHDGEGSDYAVGAEW